MTEKNPNLVRQTCDLPRDEVARFKELYPYTSLAGILRLLFHQFMKRDEESIQRYIIAAASEAREELRK